MKYNSIHSKLTLKNLFYILILCVILYILSTSIYFVRKNEIGITKTLGKITKITKSGLHIKLPNPIQQVNIINILDSNILKIGISSTDEHRLDENSFELVTSNKNIVNINCEIEWKVINPNLYLLNSKNPNEILKSTAKSCITNTIANYSFDFLLSSKLFEIENEIVYSLENKISSYNIGIQIIDCKINEIVPPEQVLSSFEKVQNSIKESNTIINKAQEYKNNKLSSAQCEANKLISEAEAYNKEKTNETNAEILKYNTLLEQYKINKELTKTKLTIETLEQVLPSSTVIIVDHNNNIINDFKVNKVEGEKIE